MRFLYFWLLIILILATDCCRNKPPDFIRINHIGINSGDRSNLKDLIVSTSRLPVKSSFEKNIVVSEEIFDRVLELAMANNTHITRYPVDSYASFNVLISVANAKISYALSTERSSIYFFENLKKACVPKSIDLCYELDHILAEIDI